jgi:hypothetical protein
MTTPRFGQPPNRWAYPAIEQFSCSKVLLGRCSLNVYTRSDNEGVMGIFGWMLTVVGVLLGVIVVVLVTGMLLPKAHLVSLSLNVDVTC